MTATEVQIPRKLTNELLHLAQLSPDAEICGLVGAINAVPQSCYPVDNIADSPINRFQLDAKQQIAAMKMLRDKGEELFAIYHSHPHAPAEPSRRDIEEATYHNTIYLIISLNTKGVLEMRGYKLDGAQAHEVVLQLRDED
jgi:[CysO sulfur-carrier protein]-S-L-cysteine hydrolase